MKRHDRTQSADFAGGDCEARSELGAQITKDFAGNPSFSSACSRARQFFSPIWHGTSISTPLSTSSRVSSYGNRPSPTQELKSGWDSTGEVKLTKDVDQSMKSKNVILVEDILDTGLTMTYLKKMLFARQPKSLKVAALLDKPSRRKLPLEGDYVGFKIPDEFVVGYGLDYAEKYRNLADICIVPRE